VVRRKKTRRTATSRVVLPSLTRRVRGRSGTVGIERTLMGNVEE
jgi:hypothetical protein